jgi:autotransporter-associated beta strand protein
VKSRLHPLSALLLCGLLLLVMNAPARAGNAAWNLKPENNIWDNALNWTPATEPNGPADSARFNVSEVTDVVMVLSVEVHSIVFNPGASAFTFTPFQSVTMPLVLSGAGIQNNSNAIQTFVAAVLFLNEGLISFTGSASAGNRTAYIAQGAEEMLAHGGLIQFSENASGGSGNFFAAGGHANGAYGGSISFGDAASAETGAFRGDGGLAAGAFGGRNDFFDNSTAGMAQLTANGSAVSGGNGGQINFFQASTASSATLTALGGTDGGRGGAILFHEDTAGGNARVILTGNGLLDISTHHVPGLTVGSVEGDGTIFLGANTLTVTGPAVTAFSGVIRDGGVSGGMGGSLGKLGTGRLTLSGANTYTGGTILSAGTLAVGNLSGSATGSGSVQVNAGILGGSGTVSGAVTVGTGSGAGAFLAPAARTNKKTTFTTQSAINFKTDATYTYTFKAKKKKARTDKVVANGVTISGGRFAFQGTAQGTLKQGLVFTVINNTAATPIAGTFSNLADGSMLTVGSNTFQANYEGGDGNDLTLTVVP